jgi:hypothetical protein
VQERPIICFKQLCDSLQAVGGSKMGSLSMNYQECQWSFHFKNFVFGTSDSQMPCAIGISVMSLCFVSIEILAMSLSALLRLNWNLIDVAFLRLQLEFRRYIRCSYVG